VNGTALKQAQGANAIVDTMSATVIKKHNPGMSDTQLRQLITAHIDEDEFLPLCDTTGHKRDCPCSAGNTQGRFFSASQRITR